VSNGAGLAGVLGSCFVMTDSVDCLQLFVVFLALQPIVVVLFTAQ
jgi:hypothetical protein